MKPKQPNEKPKSFLKLLQEAYDKKEESGHDREAGNLPDHLDRLENVLLTAQTLGNHGGLN